MHREDRVSSLASFVVCFFCLSLTPQVNLNTVIIEHGYSLRSRRELSTSGGLYAQACSYIFCMQGTVTHDIHSGDGGYGMVWYGVVWYGVAWCVVWYGNVISPGEAFSHEATSRDTQNRKEGRGE